MSELETIREERRYNEEREYRKMQYDVVCRSHYIFHNYVFTLNIFLCTISILIMYYIGSNVNKILAIFPMVSFVILVCSMVKLLNAFYETSRLDVNRNDIDKENAKIRKKENQAYEWFKISVFVLISGMIFVFFQL